MSQGRYRKQACGYEGCRAYAMKEGTWCVAHDVGRPPRASAAPKGNQNSRRHGMHSGQAQAIPTMVNEGGISEAARKEIGVGAGPMEDCAEADLDREIRATRQALGQVMSDGLASPELLKALNIGTTTLTRLLRTKQKMEATGRNELREVVQRALRDLGLDQS